ncbi:MAG: cytochrome c maturation protein CcmE [Alphaproteobacteria bacterium]|nr:cytochrome c maturation protein CcmE [Alphaproteobacteria bacterium]
MKRKNQRMLFVAAGLSILAFAGVLAFFALGNNVRFFYSPGDLRKLSAPPSGDFHLGGLVAKGSVRRDNDMKLHFTITDGAASVPVIYDQAKYGLVPDLFAEGQGAVAEGELRPDGTFVAERVLAKHDEKYMPPEVAAALKRNGEWKRGQQPAEQAP